MKVFIHYEPSAASQALGALEMHTLKAGLPKSWCSGPVERLKTLFLDAYKAKHGVELAPAQWRLVTPDGKVLEDAAVLEEVVSAGMDLRFRPAPPPALPRTPRGREGVGGEGEGGGLLTCKRYGCLKQFREEENAEGSCVHHTAPPCFNDARKWWACCKDVVAYDWDEFMQLQGCATGRWVRTPHSVWAPTHTQHPPHSSTPRPPPHSRPSRRHTTVKPEAAVASPRGAGAPPTLIVGEGHAGGDDVQSIHAFNTSNPTAVTAASSVAKTVTTRPHSIRREDGQHRCMNKACRAEWFTLGDNHDAACTFHSGAPVFHDGGKKWSCCETSISWTFEEFMAIPGCVTGAHDPGVLPP